MIGAICTAQLHEAGLQTYRCPTCEGERGFLVEYYEWYGGVLTCLACGDEFGEEGRAERPFERAWRPKRIAQALARIERYLHGGMLA